MMPTETLYLALAFFAVATFYSSVGFGGGSSYLALLALFLVADTALIRSTALLCNLAVVSGNVVLRARAGHVHWRRFAPFVLLSVPAAYLGATLSIGRERFFWLLGTTLLAAALLLVWRTLKTHRGATFPAKTYSLWIGPALGGGIGLLSGIVGIGGGIFLAPVLHHLRWAGPVHVAALASLFILVNSVAGLAGLATVGDLRLDAALTPLCLLAVVSGGQLGARWGVKSFSPSAIRLVTAVLVGAVGLRILLTT